MKKRKSNARQMHVCIDVEGRRSDSDERGIRLSEARDSLPNFLAFDEKKKIKLLRWVSCTPSTRLGVGPAGPSMIPAPRSGSATVFTHPQIQIMINITIVVFVVIMRANNYYNLNGT